MQFSDSTNLDGIVEYIVWKLGFDPANGVTNIPDLSLKDIARESNNALDIFEPKLMRAQDTWTWDSTEHNNMPRGRADLVSGQREYAIRNEFLTVERVEVIDDQGNGHPLEYISSRDFTERSIVKDYEETDGTPEEYMTKYKTIFLFPAPDFDREKGLVVYFERQGKRFTATGNDDRTPGIPAPFHKWIPLYVVLEYAETGEYSDRFKRDIKEKMDEIESEMTDFMSDRAGNEPQQLKVRDENYGDTMLI